MLGSRIIILVDSYPVGLGPISLHERTWAKRLVAPGVGQAEWDYSQQRL
jgi:hypothetical protein